jgi:hypothetical protein
LSQDYSNTLQMRKHHFIKLNGVKSNFILLPKFLQSNQAEVLINANG